MIAVEVGVKGELRDKGGAGTHPTIVGKAPAQG